MDVNQKLLDIALKGAFLYADKLIETGRKEYFNTPIGSSVRNIRHALQAMRNDLHNEDKSTSYVLDLIQRVRDDVTRSDPKRFENEQDLLSVFEDVSYEYIAFTILRDNVPSSGLRM